MRLKATNRAAMLSIIINLYYQEDLLGSFCSVAENSLISNNWQTSLAANEAVQRAKMPAKLPKLK